MTTLDDILRAIEAQTVAITELTAAVRDMREDYLRPMRFPRRHSGPEIFNPTENSSRRERGA